MYFSTDQMQLLCSTEIQSLLQDGDEGEDVVERIIEGSRGDSHDVGTANIAHHTSLLNSTVHLVEVTVEDKAELTAALLWLLGSDDLQLSSQPAVEQRLKISVEQPLFCQDPLHPRLLEDLKAGQVERCQPGRGVAQAEGFGSRCGVDVVSHLKSRLLRVAPPTLQVARHCTMVLRVDKGTSNPACPTVEIFVGTPDGKVNAPLIEMQGHIAHCISQVPTNLCSNSLALSGDDVHLELLPGVVLQPAEHDEGDGVSFPSDRLNNVLRPDCVLTRSWTNQDKAVFIHPFHPPC